MPYQFGTQRLAKKPLTELLEMQKARQVKEQGDAMRTMRQFKFRDVYKDKDGAFKENITDKDGRLIPATISEASYSQALDDNRFHNQQRDTLGLNATQTSPIQEEEEDGGFIEGVKKFSKSILNRFGGDKKTNPPAKLQTLDDGQKLNQKDQMANPNIGGVNVDLSKPSTGGAVTADLSKPVIEDTSKGLPMDVTNKAQTSFIPDPNNPTEIAYQNSLNPVQNNKPKVFTGTPETEKAYKSSLYKGKPAPDLSDRERANIADGSYAKTHKSIDKRRKHLQHIIDVKKEQKANKGEFAEVYDPISKSMQPNSYWTQEFKDANSQTFKDSRHRGVKPNQSRRLALPNKEEANRGAQQQLANIEAKKIQDAKDKSFIASAKSSNQKAKDAMQRYQESIRPTSPNTASVVYKDRDKTTISPDVQDRIRIPNMAEADIFRNPQDVQRAGGRKNKEDSIVAKNRVNKAKKEVLGKFSKDIKSGAKSLFDAYSRMANRKPKKQSEQFRRLGSFK